MKGENKKDTSFLKELVILFLVFVGFGEFYLINDLTIRHKKSVNNWSIERKMLYDSIRVANKNSRIYADSLKACNSEAQKTFEHKIKKFFSKIDQEDENKQ